jgi:hypothetical protein
MSTARRDPEVAIVLRIEEPPLIRTVADSEEDFARLTDWILHNRDQHDLVLTAIELRPDREEHAA